MFRRLRRTCRTALGLAAKPAAPGSWTKPIASRSSGHSDSVGHCAGSGSAPLFEPRASPPAFPGTAGSPAPRRSAQPTHACAGSAMALGSPPEVDLGPMLASRTLGGSAPGAVPVPIRASGPRSRSAGWTSPASVGEPTPHRVQRKNKLPQTAKSAGTHTQRVLGSSRWEH